MAMKTKLKVRNIIILRSEFKEDKNGQQRKKKEE